MTKTTLSSRWAVALLAPLLAVGCDGLGSGLFANTSGGGGAGYFVIGVNDAVVGKHVTFWGAQWWKDNSLAMSSAPPSFKGYADLVAPPACGGTWTTRPGNSSFPPTTLPPVIAAIASATITKSGAVISGDAPEIVSIQVDPGYQADPGHPGTGVVLSVSCSGVPAPDAGASPSIDSGTTPPPDSTPASAATDAPAPCGTSGPCPTGQICVSGSCQLP